MIDAESIISVCNSQHAVLMRDYMRYMILGEKHFLLREMSKDVKLEQLKLLNQAIRRDFPLRNNMLARLQKNFVEENLSLYLLLDVLQGWRYGIDYEIKKEGQLSELCGYILSPLARLLMVLHNENPSTYLPISSLLVCMYQYELFLSKSPLVKNVKISKKNKINKFKGLIKNSKVVLHVVKSKRLKYKLALLLNTMQVKVLKLEKNKQPELGNLDCIQIFLYTIYQFVFVRQKTVDKRGI